MNETTQKWAYISAAIVFVIGAIIMLVYSFGGIAVLFPIGMVLAGLAGITLIVLQIIHRRSQTPKTDTHRQ